MNEKENSKLINEFEDELFKIYPSFQFGYSSGSSGDGILTSQQYEFLVWQKALWDSCYDFKPQREFIHYTSLESLYGILNSGEIRLYDLNSLNDPYEFNFIIKKLNISFDEKQVQHFKQSLFITSLCTYDEKNPDNFDMWRLYGNNGSGVAIVFEILNSEDNWRHFLLGKIQYGADNDSTVSIQKAIDLINFYVTKKGMILDRIPELIGYLLMLHKNEIWKVENEYRLGIYAGNRPYSLTKEFLFDHHIDNFIKKRFSFFMNRNKSQSSYLSFPLVDKIQSEYGQTKDYEEFSKKVPMIKVKKVIAGYALSDDFIADLNMYTYLVSIEKWNYNIRTEKSHLKEWF